MSYPDFTSTIEHYLRVTQPELLSFWNGETPIRDLPKIPIQDYVDYIYVKFLMGSDNWCTEKSVREYAEFVATLPLYGTIDHKRSLLPHLTAYLLGSINLLALKGFDYRDMVYGKLKFNLDYCVNPVTNLPNWPLKWSHHTWRVSHWIGGIPSILINVAKNKKNAEWDENLAIRVLESCDEKLIDSNTGLLKAHKSEFIQAIFRFFYRLRHNPEHGDIGGLVHLHWINYVVGRKYKASKQLLLRSVAHIKDITFLEKTPYCLDFDYVQLIRTILDQNSEERTEEIILRMRQYEHSVGHFLGDIPLSGYSLHKLPGALATWHEARLCQAQDEPDKIKPIDIIKCAYWL